MTLAVHRYQNKSLLMIFFAAGDQGIRLVIDESLIAKKMKILSKTYVMYIKKKAEDM